MTKFIRLLYLWSHVFSFLKYSINTKDELY